MKRIYVDLPNRLTDRIPAWMLKGTCRLVPHLSWFVENDYVAEATPEVRQICASCPVRGVCLDWALAHVKETSEAVYGGLTPLQRRQITQELRREHCPGCGSADIVDTYDTTICLACALSWRI